MSNNRKEVTKDLLYLQERFISEVMGGWGQCFSCVHYRGEGKCPAFSDSIPLDIISDVFIHNHKHPDQENNDILFEAK